MKQSVLNTKFTPEKLFTVGITIRPKHDFTYGCKVSKEGKSLLQLLGNKLICSTEELILANWNEHQS
jgi:hypothetical protein